MNNIKTAHFKSNDSKHL